jgi:transcriptional regulator with XRE-family HTH domain
MSERRGPSPTVRRRRLADELRRLREESGKSAAEVARTLRWGDTKPLYLENRHAERPDPHDVARLCGVYGVSDEQRDELVQLAEDSRVQGWWAPYKGKLPRDYTTYIGLEAETFKIETFEPLILPGLLQTEEYAHALILQGRAQHGAPEVARRVKVRTERQKILTGNDPAHLWAIVDEAAIRRVVGGPQVMRAQLEYLLELSELPHVTLQVVPFNAGAHPGVAGSFSILKFRDPRDAPTAYIETIAGQLFVEKEQEVAEYSDAFARLKDEKALQVPDTIAVIAAAAATI